MLRERRPIVAPAEALRPGGDSAVALALTLTFLVGAALSLQSFLNGKLGRHLGAPELAASVNFLGGLVVVMVLAVGSGAAARGLRRVREGARPRWWHWIGGLLGASLVLVAAKAAPVVGVALLTVALVSGQTGGGLAVDAAGLSPAGRQHPTRERLLGVGLAIAAVAISAAGAHGELHLGLLALALAVGVASAFQQASNGRLSAVTGEPLFATLVNFVVGGAALVTLVLITTGGHAPGGWSAPFPEWLGGLIGVAVVIVTVKAVPVLGVLRLSLALVAGQTTGALIIDLIAPAQGEPVTAGTVAGVALTLLAVLVSGRGRARARAAER